MTTSNENLANDKLLILYILQKINKPINYKELLELVISISDMNYFNFHLIRQLYIIHLFFLNIFH